MNNIVKGKKLVEAQILHRKGKATGGSALSDIILLVSSMPFKSLIVTGALSGAFWCIFFELLFYVPFSGMTMGAATGFISK